MPLPEANLMNPSSLPIRIALEPAYNAFYSLMLVKRADDLSGFGEWVQRTAAAFTREERERHALVMEGLHYAAAPTESWPSFPAYLDHLQRTSPEDLKNKLLRAYLNHPYCLIPPPNPTTDLSTALTSPENYLLFLQERFAEMNPQIEIEAYRYVIDPPALKRLVVNHLQGMWDRFLAAEWERTYPVLQSTLNAFRQLDYRGMSLLEAGRQITGQDLEDQKWQAMFGEALQAVFVPNPHIGPYLGKFQEGRTLGIFFGPHLPKGAQIQAPDLSRAEILVRLAALADESRLRILKLVAERGELRSPEVIQLLDLSQSAASRHLQQLTATGYLNERRCDGAKCYTLNPDRLEDTLQAIAAYLGVPQREIR